MKRSLVVAAALLLMAAGCGDSDSDDDTSSDDPTTEPTGATYVSQVNQLCEALIDEVVPITGNSAPTPSRERYLSNRTKLEPIYAEFDASVAEIPAQTEEDEAAKAAFDAYLAALRADDAELIEMAMNLSEAKWVNGFEQSMDAFFTSPARTAMVSTGIQCPAR